MKAKVIDYSITTTKDGLPQVALRFACEDGKARSWFGSLKPGKAEEITLDTILRCGFQGSDPLELDAGPSANLLDMEKELDLTVENETYQGKTREKVQWVNEVGGAGFKGVMAKGEAVKKFAGMNLKASLAARKALMPKKTGTDEDPF